MPDLTWTTDLTAAGGLANVTLYRMVAENPTHNDSKIVADKMLVIGRVYSAAVTRGGGKRNEEESALPESLYQHLAELVVSVGPDLDDRLRKLGTLDRVSSLNLHDIADCHRFLASTLVAGINGWRSTASSREVHARDSFVSKYLHFHAPQAFFILDSIAQNKLKADGMLGWRARWPADFSKTLRTPYASYCLRLLTYIERKYPAGVWSPRSVDGRLLGYLPYS